MKKLLILILIVPGLSWGYTTLKCEIEDTSTNYFMKIDIDGKKPLLWGSRLDNLINIEEDSKKDCEINTIIDDNFFIVESFCLGDDLKYITKLNRYTLEYTIIDKDINIGLESISRKDKCELI